MRIAQCAIPTSAGSRATRGSRSPKASPRRPERAKLARNEISRPCRRLSSPVSTKRVGDMSDTTTHTRTSKTSRATVAADNPAVGTLRTEVPASFLDLFEKSVARAKDAHEKVASIVEHSAEAFEEAFSCANRGSI